MAPPPEYDKEPKAPDKSATNFSSEDSKLLHNLVNDQHTNSDYKSTNTVAAVEVENNKHVETLDDGQLKALLDEAINYKNPKDREGKSKIFKELLEEVEQESDEQACSAARALSGGRGGRRGARRGPALAHSNSLQDLVAALAAEPPRRHHVRATPAPPPSVSARAIHGGSLPSGVDTSSLSEEPARGAGYLATVRCVNPPPLAERRVSASDANAPAEMELLNRRSKPMFPMTYTARATLEIGSGAVCSGRAVTTTTASNQVRTPASARQVPADPQAKLLSALRCGGGRDSVCDVTGKTNVPRGPAHVASGLDDGGDGSRPSTEAKPKPMQEKDYLEKCPTTWVDNVDNWYKSLSNYTEPLKTIYNENFKTKVKANELNKVQDLKKLQPFLSIQSANTLWSTKEIEIQNKSKFAMENPGSISPKHVKNQKQPLMCIKEDCQNTHSFNDYDSLEQSVKDRKVSKSNYVIPSLSDINPRNVKPMTIAQPMEVGRDLIKNCSLDLFEKNEQENNSVDINSNTVNDENKEKLETTESEGKVEYEDPTPQCNDCCNCDTTKKCEQLNELVDMFNKLDSYANADREIELKDVKGNQQQKNQKDSFSQYVALQQKLIIEIESLQEEINSHQHNNNHLSDVNKKNIYQTSLSKTFSETDEVCMSRNNISTDCCVTQLCSIPEDSDEPVNHVHKFVDQTNTVTSGSSDCTAVSNNAYVLLTLPRSNNTESFVSETASKPKTGKKKENLSLAPSHTNKKEDALNKNILKVLLFENLFKNDNNEKSGNPGVSSITNDEVDSAISFSCITTPEVVASCNTTSSTSQSAVAVDPKPRSVISSSFNGLPLSRPNYGAAAAAADDYKKSLDENGNSVQGFSSPLSGSSQHKKPRRKKTSKNETVIDCQQIDGYQGDKDVNELLRFIESNADNGRAAKLPRVKHKDDSDDKSGKKRSAERRKDKENKIKRATSMEELSRTKIEDLTDATEAPLRQDKKERRDHAAAKAERRSWGDDARDAYEPPDGAGPALELTDFQTVTKKRKPRRRADEPERDPPRRARPPSPRRRESAPPSDRSNDSNDDLDSVHSLPDALRAAPAPAPAPHASYADIARTRHNIPDLIESCNYYAEGDAALPQREPAAPADAEPYPALEPRAAGPRRRDAKPPPPAPRARKERPPAEPRAPDVVADRRPPVILLDSAARPRDMDGVTFGFDINEQLLGGPARRPRCDLVRDAVAGVLVRAGGGRLRYVPPEPPPDSLPLLQLIDYVGAAWEDAVRCGGGKARYYSE